MNDQKKNTPDFNDKNLNEIWADTEKSPPKSPVSKDEIENALQAVHSRISSDSSRGERKQVPEKNWIKSRYLVAALALIVFGAYYIFIPKSYTVPYGEMATLELPDGSVAEMNSGTTISYSRFFGWNHRELSINGEVYFSVEKDHKPFIVAANGSITEVKGTRFNIRSWADDPISETIITVTEGVVEFYPAGSADAKVEISQGNQSRWHAEMTSPSTLEPVTVSDITGWRENRLIFKEQPLGVILKELERRYNTRINLEVPGAEMETLTAYYAEPGNITAVLEDISLVKGFRYSATSNGYRIFK